MRRERIVIETKLEPPLLRGKVVRRDHLLELLKANLDKKLILICADAGYGKTTLAMQLCREMGRPFVFYNLDAADNDLPVFYAYLVHAVRRLLPGFGADLLAIARQTRNTEILFGTFINEFVKKVKQDVYIVLDDYHHLQLNAEINQGLDFLLQRAPAGLHLVVTSRATPPLNLALYLAKQQMVGLDKPCLRFTSEETRTLLRDIYGLQIPQSEVARVEEHSEGWATAIQLILQKIAFSGEDRVRETLNGYVASGEDLFEYFAREVFENQPEKVRGFLVKTAFLDEMSVDICNRLLKARDSQAMFNHLEKNHLFITRAAGSAYRYHPLFQNFVQDYARKHLPRETILAGYARIGRVHLERGDPAAAADSFLKAEAYARASACVKKAFEAMLQNCHFNRLLAWFDAFPVPVMDRDPGLALMKADTLVHVLRADEALGLYAGVMRRARRARNQRGLFRARFGEARVFASAGRFKEALEELEACVRLAPRAAEQVAARNLMGVCRIHLSDFSRAESDFNEALRISSRAGVRKDNHQLLNNLAIIAFTRGDMAGALRMFKRLAAAGDNPLAEPHFHSNVALVLIDLGRLDEAREELLKAYRSSRIINNPRGYLAFLLSLGFYHLERREFDRALRYFTSLHERCGAMGDRLTEVRALYGLMKTHYLAGRPDQARLIADELVKREGENMGIRNLDTFLTKALIDLELGRIAEAEGMLLRCLEAVENTDFVYTRMRVEYFLARLYLKKNNLKQADERLARSLAAARGKGFDYFLVRSARQDRSPLDRAQAAGILPDYVDSIFRRLLKETRVDVRFFGDFEVRIDGEPVGQADWATKKAQVVFAYLVLNRERGVPKEELMRRFSEQEEPGLADQAIRTTVSRIQKALGLPGFIAYRRGVYRVDPSPAISVDTESFEASIKPASKPGGRPGKEALDAAAQALALYRGDFLASFYDDWCDGRRRYLRDLYLTCLQNLGDACLAQKEPLGALGHFQRLVQAEPLSEAGAAGVIRSFTALGDKRRAKEAYEAYLSRIKDDPDAAAAGDLAGLLDQQDKNLS